MIIEIMKYNNYKKDTLIIIIIILLNIQILKYYNVKYKMIFKILMKNLM